MVAAGTVLCLEAKSIVSEFCVCFRLNQHIQATHTSQQICTVLPSVSSRALMKWRAKIPGKAKVLYLLELLEHVNRQGFNCLLTEYAYMYFCVSSKAEKEGGMTLSERGSVLVFLPGIHEISYMQEALTKLVHKR